MKPSEIYVQHEHGSSLIETMIAVGIVGIITLAVASLITTMSQEQRRLREQLARMELTNFITQVMSRPTACKATLTSPSQLSFDSTSLPANGDIPSGSIAFSPGNPAISNGDRASPIAPTLIVQALNLVDIVNAGSADTWTGELQVSFDQSKLAMPLADAKIRITFQTDPTSPPNNKLVSECGPSTSIVNLISGSSLQYSGWTNNVTSISCPADHFLSQCHAETNSGDGKSNFFENHVNYVMNGAGVPVGCESTMSDPASDTYRLVILCLR